MGVPRHTIAKRVGVAGLLLLALLLGAWVLRSRGEQPDDRLDAGRPAAASAPRSTSTGPQAPLGDEAISGRVLDAQGAPLAGAEVQLAPDSSASLASEPCDCATCHKKLLECGCPAAAAKVALLVSRREGEWIPSETTRSGPDGAFAFPRQAAGRYSLLAFAPGRAPAMRRGVATGETIDLTLGEPRALVGKVLDEQGAPVAGALVTAVSALLPRFDECASGPDGSFRIEGLDEGPHYLAASADGFLPTGLPLKLILPSPVTISLPRPRSVEVRVLDRGAPAAGATVRLFAEHLEIGLGAENGVARADGLFPGDYSVSATLGKRSASADLKLASRSTRITLELEDALLATGRVADDEGAPIEGATVVASLGSRRIAEARSAADGRFELAGVPPGARLTASAEGYEPESTRLGEDEAPIELRLRPLTLVSGRVLSATGAPLPEVQVLAKGASGGTATSDAFGVFRLPLDGPGPVTLMAHHSTHGAGEVSVEAPASDVVLSLSPLGGLRARLVDERGNPIPGARATAWLEQARLRTETFSTDTASGDDGQLVLAGLGAGSYRVRFSAKGYQNAERREVAVPAQGENALGEITLEAGLSITGTVLGPEGEPAAGAFVHARGRGARPGEGFQTGPDGAFEVVGLRAGTYQLAAFLDKSTAEQTASAGESGVVLRLSPAARLRGRVLDQAGRPITSFFVDGEPISAPDGRFEVSVRAYREHVLFRVSADRKLTELKQAHLGSDGVADAGDITLESARAVEGRVVDGSGEGLAGARVSSADSDHSSRDDDAGGSTISREGGFFRLEGLAPGPATLLARRGSAMGEASIRIPADQDLRDATITVQQTGSVEGTVSGPDGQPLTAEVHTRTVSTSSDARGRYRIDGLLPGTHLVVFMLETEGFRALARQVEVHEGETVKLDVELGGGATLKVLVAGAAHGMVHLLKAGPAGQPDENDLSSLQTSQLVDGAAIFGGLQGGLYTAMFYDEEGELAAHGVADVRDGVTSTIELSPRQAASDYEAPFIEEE